MGEPIRLRFMDRTLCLDLYFPFASSACLLLYFKLLEATGNRIRFLHSPGGAFGLFLFFYILRRKNMVKKFYFLQLEELQATL